MSIPNFDSFMLPIIQCLADGQVKHKSEIIECVAEKLHLTEEDKKQLLPSGTEETYRSRTSWCLSFLKHAKLISSPSRAHYQIEERGEKVLKDNIDTINHRYLSQYEEYIRFYSGKKGEKDTHKPKPGCAPADNLTPQEYIEYGYQQIKDELGTSVLEEVKKTSPYRFEKIVVELLLAMGYGGSLAEAGQVTQKTSDGGIDGIINEDKLGLDVIYIQAKRWENTVSRPEIQKFAGALMGKKAKKGIFITTSTFSSEALKYAQDIDSRIILIDGERLAKLMIEHNVGVSISQTYNIKKVDSDYFLEE